MNRDTITNEELRDRLEEYFNKRTETKSAIHRAIGLDNMTMTSFKLGNNIAITTRNKIFNFLQEREKHVDNK